MSAEYRDLPKLVGKLKLAAIDAYMVSKSRYKIDKGRKCTMSRETSDPRRWS